MSKSLFLPTGLSNHVSRNGFDLSRKVSFTAKAGELLPVWTQEVIPGDRFKINLMDFLRTQPLNTASFARMRKYYDFYFVPYRLLWRYAPEFFTQMTDNLQSAFSSSSKANVGTLHPWISGTSLAVQAAKLHENSKSNYFGLDRGELATKLFYYLGYYGLGNINKLPYGSSSTGVDHAPALNVFPLLAYQKIYSDFFRNTQWQDSEPWTFNVDYLPSNLGSSPSMEVTFPSDLSQSTFIDLRYSDLRKDMFTGVLPNSQYGAVSTVSVGELVTGASPFTSVVLDGGSSSLGSTYRLDNSTFVNKAAYGTEVTQKLRTRGTGNPYAGTFAVADDGTKILTDQVLWGNDLRTLWNAFINGASLNKLNTFNILSLRKAEALQKFKEIQLSNEQDYPAQVKAIFGVDVSKVLSNRCRYLGGTHSDVQISEVVNTNITGDNQADIAGKGVSAGKGTIDFTASEHGIIMCIFHVLPQHEYTMQSFSPLVQKTSVDQYANPVFDRIGYESVPAINLYDFTPVGGWNLSYKIFGYNPRYIDYKTDYDVVLGDFSKYNAGTSLNWNVFFNPLDLLDYDIEADSMIPNWQGFKCNPHILDSLFGVNADSSVSTDQFLCEAFFDVKVVRNLDRDGMPY